MSVQGEGFIGVDDLRVGTVARPRTRSWKIPDAAPHPVEHSGSEQRRRHFAQGVMRPVFVVVGQPGVGSVLYLADRVEQPGVEHLLAEAAVEALDECVLVRLASSSWRSGVISRRRLTAASCAAGSVASRSTPCSRVCDSSRSRPDAAARSTSRTPARPILLHLVDRLDRRRVLGVPIRGAFPVRILLYT